MRLAQLHRLSQGNLKSLCGSDLKWLAQHNCHHNRPLLTHPTCYRGMEEHKERVLLFDLETTANEGFFWGRGFETNIIETTNYGKILSFAAKWSGEKVICKGWIDYRDKEKGLVKELWGLVNQADVLVAHNGKSFDIKWINTAFLRYGLPTLNHYKVVDTKTEAKKYLYLPSYSLNNIADYFGFGHKVEHEGWPLWKRCIAGVKSAWKRMKEYNIFDVILLEKVYEKLKTFQK